MSRNLKFSSVLIAALAFAACGDDGGDDGPTPGAGDAGTGGGACMSTDTYTSFGKALIDTNCAICHSAALDMSKMMNTKLQTVEGIRAAKDRIIKHAVRLEPVAMPMAGPLPQADRDRLKAWLDCNAP
jgi:cytochrome c5